MEKWQGGADVGELPVSAYPVMFDIEEEAKAWATGKVLEKRAALKAGLNGDTRQLVAELNGTAETLGGCEHAIKFLMNPDNFGTLTEIRKNKAELRERISALGMFKGKEKKELNAELAVQTAKEEDYLKLIREERRSKGAEYCELSEKLEAGLCRAGNTEICTESWTNKTKPFQVQYEAAEAFTLISKGYYSKAMKVCPGCGFHSPRIAFYCGSCGKKFE